LSIEVKEALTTAKKDEEEKEEAKSARFGKRPLQDRG